MVPVEIGARDVVQWVLMALDDKYTMKGKGMPSVSRKASVWFSIRFNRMRVRGILFPQRARILVPYS